MSKAKTPTETRQHEHELHIEASPATVWKTITDASELLNWFPLEAEVEPGQGGKMTLGWGEGLRGTCEIQSWQPERHLKTSWMQAIPAQSEEARPLAVEWFLEGAGATTRLRLVHSGFGPGEEWDEEYDGTRRGWSFQLRSLKHYLEHHRGAPRRYIWLRKAFSQGAAEAWRKLVHPQGLIQSSRLAQANAGDPVNVALASGDRVEGSVLLCLPTTDLLLVADNWNKGLFRVAHENCGFGPEVSVVVCLWNYPEQEGTALQARLQGALGRVFQ